MLSNAPVTAIAPAQNIERAKKFYGETLGLKSLPAPTSDDALFEAGKGTTIYLYQRPPSHAEHTLAAFLVDNIEEEMKALKDKGVVFEEYDMPGLKTENGVATWGNAKSAWFKDSEGNILSLTQM